MAQIVEEQARLIILKSLAEQNDERLNSDLIVSQLAMFGISKDRNWVHEHLRFLEDIDAVSVTSVGSVKVAALTEKGARHVSRDITIEGIQRPQRPGG